LLPIFIFIPAAEFEYAVLIIYGAYINTFLGVFNMLPIGMLDGRNIIKWKKKYWILLMIGLLLFLALEFYMMFNIQYLYEMKL
jgi:Zn-dependent protease